MSITRTTRTALSVTAVAGLLAAGLVACSSQDSSGGGVAEGCTPAHEGLTTFTEGTLTVGVPENLPYSKTEGNDATGLDIEVIKKIAEAECLSTSFVPITYANGVPMISEQKKTDVITGGWYVTEDRAKQVGFTTPTFYDTMGIVSADGASTVTELESIGDVASGAGFSWEADMGAVLGDKMKTYPGTIEMKQDLTNGRVQAVLDGYAVAVAAFADTDFVVEQAQPDDRIAITTEKPIIAFPVSKDNAELSDAMSELIDGYREDGTLVQLLADYELPEDLLVPADVASTSIR